MAHRPAGFSFPLFLQRVGWTSQDMAAQLQASRLAVSRLGVWSQPSRDYRVTVGWSLALFGSLRQSPQPARYLAPG